MVALKSIEYVTDSHGRKKCVVLSLTDFQKLREEMEDLEDALALEKARKQASGFKRWTDFLKEQSTAKRSRPHGV